MRRLFMQDFESPRNLRHLALLVALVVVTFVAGDWLLGRLLPLITIEPPFILRFQNVQGVEKLWDFAAEGIEPIVFTGSSQIYSGLSPHIFNDRIKAISGTTVNSVDITVWGGVITIQHDLIRNFILTHHPQRIIYGIEMQALLPSLLNGHTVEDFRNKAFGYAISRESSFERSLLLWLLEHSNWVRYRDNFREWLTGTRRINQLEYPPNSVDDLGFYNEPKIADRDPITIQVGFAPFTATDAVRQLVADIGVTCRNSGVQCVLLNMPIHPLAYDYIASETEKDYQTTLRVAGLDIWDFNTPDCQALLGDSSFYNLNHLNTQGAERFSRMVADVYASVFYGVPITSDATCAVITPQ
ncbi:MAG: hypothetical protein LCI00_26035 [Chloroflexi bacterium]|nr:hypothetical protein [Chloroflexota bacterium]MCC6895315.1 hypothetical protein [Anaerolineae bacterium]